MFNLIFYTIYRQIIKQDISFVKIYWNFSNLSLSLKEVLYFFNSNNNYSSTSKFAISIYVESKSSNIKVDYVFVFYLNNKLYSFNDSFVYVIISYADTIPELSRSKA